MNQLAHVFLNYLIFSLFIPDVKKYLIPIILFAIILDFDHIPGYVKMLFISKKDKSRMQLKDYVNLFRTPLQEPIGIIIIEFLLIIIYLYQPSMITMIAIISVLLHWILDFLTVHTKPFAPFDNRIVSAFFHTKKQRIISEILITGISAVLFVITII